MHTYNTVQCNTIAPGCGDDVIRDAGCARDLRQLDVAVEVSLRGRGLKFRWGLGVGEGVAMGSWG